MEYGLVFKIDGQHHIAAVGRLPPRVSPILLRSSPTVCLEYDPPVATFEMLIEFPLDTFQSVVINIGKSYDLRSDAVMGIGPVAVPVRNQSIILYIYERMTDVTS